MAVRPKPVTFVYDPNYTSGKGPAPYPLHIDNVQTYINPATVTTTQLGQALINLGLMKSS